MRLFWIYALLLVWVPLIGNSQNGDFFMSHFTPPHLDRSYQIFDMVQDDKGIMYFAHRGGLLVFEGNEWQNVQAPGSIFSLEVSADGQLFAGGPQGIFKVHPHSTTGWEFTPLHAEDFIKDVTEFELLDSVIYAISDREVYRLSLNSTEIKRFDPVEGVFWSDIYVFKNEPHFLTEEGNSFTVEGEFLSRQTDYLGDRPMRFISESPSGDAYLVATTSNELLVYNAGYTQLMVDAVDRRDREYLRQNQIIDGKWLSDTLVVVSTLKGGVVFLRPNQSSARDVQRIVNHQSSLPDDQVFNMFVDSESALWINHDRGLTRVDPLSPLQRYDHFPGLKGEMKSVVRHRNKLYVGTSEGLFVLNEIPVYEKILTREEQWVTIEDAAPTKKGFFKKIFGKKEKPQSHQEKQSVVKSRNQFHSIRYEFSPIQGVETKVLSFQVYGNTLYAAGLGGVFKVVGDRAANVMDVPVQKLFANREVMFATTISGEVYEIHGSASTLLDVPEPIHQVVVINNEEYFIGMHALYMRNGSANPTERIPFRNPYYARTYGYQRDSELFIINQSFAGRVDREKRTIVEDSTQDLPEHIVSGTNGQFYASVNGAWEQSGARLPDQFRHLQMLEGIEYMSDDPASGGMWVVTSESVNANALYLLAPTKNYGWQTPNQIFLQSVSSNIENFAPDQPLTFGPEHTTITFRFGQPEYSSLVQTEYQYFLDGQKQKSSDWSPENRNLQLTYLPAGKYSLRVKSRNALGQVDELNNIQFEVKNPYWKQTWFYAVEFAIIALMLLISLRMKSTRYLWVSRVLALLTLITIIELIQAVAESRFETETSPVIGFIIQVILAFMILPVEEIVRKYIFKGSNDKFIDIFNRPEAPAKEIPAE